MRRLVDIDLMEDAALQSAIVRTSAIIAVVGMAVGVLGAVAFPHEAITPWWFLELGIVSVLALPVHELVHAAAFLLFSGFTARIGFGFRDWMLYTTALGTTLPKRRFSVVLLAPAVVMTTMLAVGAMLAGRPLLAWFLAVVHLAGCTGDFAFVHIIMREPAATLVQDTVYGIALFHDE